MDAIFQGMIMSIRVMPDCIFITVKNTRVLQVYRREYGYFG